MPPASDRYTDGSRRPGHPQWWLAGLLAAFVALALAGVSRMLALPDLFRAPDAWTYDLRTSLFSQTPKGPRTDIAVVLIDDDSLGEGYISRSPVDRGLQANLVRGLAAAGAKAIALDFIYDRPTARGPDQALLEALASVKVPVVVGAIDARSTPDDSKQKKFQETFIAQSGQGAGHVYFALQGGKMTIGDQVVRYRLGPSPYPPNRPGLAEAAARAAGFKISEPNAKFDGERLIAWQKAPEFGGYDQPFRVLKVQSHRLGAPAGEMLGQGWEALVKGRIVLVGGGFVDIDRHLTPFSVLDRAKQPGVFVHAQILGQILDGREVAVTPALADVVLLMLVALAGMAAAARWRWRGGDFHVWLLGAVGVFLLGLLVFAGLGLILPSGSVYLAWMAGVGLGNPPLWSRRFGGRILLLLGLGWLLGHEGGMP